VPGLQPARPARLRASTDSDPGGFGPGDPAPLLRKTRNTDQVHEAARDRQDQRRARPKDPRLVELRTQPPDAQTRLRPLPACSDTWWRPYVDSRLIWERGHARRGARSFP